MTMLLLGARPLNFIADDGREVSGTTLYVGYEKEGVDGMVAEKIFVPAAKTPKKAFVTGQDVEIEFDNRGRVVAVMVP